MKMSLLGGIHGSSRCETVSLESAVRGWRSAARVSIIQNPELLTVAFSVAPVSIPRPQSIRLLNFTRTVDSAPFNLEIGHQKRASWTPVWTPLLYEC